MPVMITPFITTISLTTHRMLMTNVVTNGIMDTHLEVTTGTTTQGKTMMEMELVILHIIYLVEIIKTGIP